MSTCRRAKTWIAIALVAVLSLGASAGGASTTAPAADPRASAAREHAVSGTTTLLARSSGSAAANAPVSLPPTSSEHVLSSRSQDAELFWAWDFVQERYYQVWAVNVYRSAAVSIYTAKGHSVPASAAQSLGRLFDDTVYPTLRETYGQDPYPGIDNRAAITVFLLDIRDPLHYGIEPYTYFSGYFDPINQQRQVDLDRTDPYARSNEQEMLYLDIAPGDVQGALIRQTLAHEFAHLIQWNYDPDEEDWLIEGVSELAVYLCGLGHPTGHVRAFLEDPTGTLVSWSGDLRDYGRVYLYMLYLYEQAAGSGSTWLGRLVRDPDNGLRSIGTSYPAGRSVDELYRDFSLALFLDMAGPSAERHGFVSLELHADDGNGRLPFPPAVEHGPGSFHAVVALEPWEMRADLIRVAPGSVDIELLSMGDICAGAAWRGADPGERARVGCLVSARPVIWPFADTGPAGRALIVTTSNATAERAVVELSSIESPRVQSHVESLILPVAFVR